MSFFAINVRKVATAVIRKEPIYSLRFGVPDLGPEDELEWANHIGRIDLPKMSARKAKPSSGKSVFLGKLAQARSWLFVFLRDPVLWPSGPLSSAYIRKTTFFGNIDSRPPEGSVRVIFTVWKTLCPVLWLVAMFFCKNCQRSCNCCDQERTFIQSVTWGPKFGSREWAWMS